MIISWVYEDVKWCSKCEIFKPISKYTNRMDSPDKLGYWCVDCRKINMYDRYHENVNGYKDKMVERKVLNPYKAWASSCLSGHRRRNKFTIQLTRDELVDIAKMSAYCPICGIRLDYKSKNGKPTKNSPSLDRKFNENVLNISNVWIICYRCNMGKGEMMIDEYIEHCRNIVHIADEGGGI